jgi:hypothetical protein
VSRTKLVAVVAAVAFPFLTAAAHADVMSAGTWEGQITGGTLSLGDGDLHTTPITVPAGTPFRFTIPAGAAAPVAWTAPGIHVDIPVRSLTDSGTTFSAAGTIDISALSGTVDPATGATTATGGAHGAFHLTTYTPVGPFSSSIYCYFGDPAAPASDPKTPAPAPLSLAGNGTLTDSTFAGIVDCADAIPPGIDQLRILGHTAMPSGANTLTLTTTFTRVPDPQPQVITKTQVVTITKTVTAPPPAVKCVVPKLKGLKLKQARKAAKAANCVVGKVKRKKSGRRPTTVLKQGQTAGAVLAEGSKIALTVAR